MAYNRDEFHKKLDSILNARKLGDDTEARKFEAEARADIERESGEPQSDFAKELDHMLNALSMARDKDMEEKKQSHESHQKAREEIDAAPKGATDLEAVKERLLNFEESFMAEANLIGRFVDAFKSGSKKAKEWKKNFHYISDTLPDNWLKELNDADTSEEFIGKINDDMNSKKDTLMKMSELLKDYLDHLNDLKSQVPTISGDQRRLLDERIMQVRSNLASVHSEFKTYVGAFEELEDMLAQLVVISNRAIEEGLIKKTTRFWNRGK
jgi:archaellum component FlaC